MAKSENDEKENFKVCILSMQTKEERMEEAIKKAKKGMKSNLFVVTHASEYEYLNFGKEVDTDKDTDYVVLPAYDGGSQERESETKESGIEI